MNGVDQVHEQAKLFVLQLLPDHRCRNPDEIQIRSNGGSPCCVPTPRRRVRRRAPAPGARGDPQHLPARGALASTTPQATSTGCPRAGTRSSGGSGIGISATSESTSDSLRWYWSALRPHDPHTREARGSATPGTWDRRGMVVGQIQSGKTGNYTGLVCRAADAGYASSSFSPASTTVSGARRSSGSTRDSWVSTHNGAS